jgi:hypothetical protein
MCEAAMQAQSLQCAQAQETGNQQPGKATWVWYTNPRPKCQQQLRFMLQALKADPLCLRNAIGPDGF